MLNDKSIMAPRETEVAFFKLKPAQEANRGTITIPPPNPLNAATAPAAKPIPPDFTA